MSLLIQTMPHFGDSKDTARPGDGPAHNFFGVAVTVNSGGIDPVEIPASQRGMDASMEFLSS